MCMSIVSESSYFRAIDANWVTTAAFAERIVAGIVRVVQDANAVASFLGSEVSRYCFGTVLLK